MKAMLFLPNQTDPVAILEEVDIVHYNQANHPDASIRVNYTSPRLNAGKTMVEMERDSKMTLRLEDGRSCTVRLLHSSIDSKGNAIGVLHVLDGFPR